jgi:MFS family permease
MHYNSIHVPYTCRRLDTCYLSVLQSTYRHVLIIRRKYLICVSMHPSTNDDYIQGLASDWTWYIQLVIYSIGLPIVLIAGPLSDRIGRKTLVVYTISILF